MYPNISKSTQIHIQISNPLVPGLPKRIMHIQLQGFEVGRHLSETKTPYSMWLTLGNKI